MTKPKFNNTPNEHFRMRYNSLHGNVGIDYWISRAPAVNGIIFAFGIEGGARVLIVKRSKNMPDEPNKFVVPCGYLDWDENGFDGMIREVYEETNMYLPDYKPFLVFDNNEQPFHVNTNPITNKQNISLEYVMVYDFKDSQEFFPMEIENFTCRETSKVEWLKIQDLYDNKYEWGFKHDKLINIGLQYYNKSVKNV